AASSRAWTCSPATRQVVASATTCTGPVPTLRSTTSATEPSAPGPITTWPVSVASARAARIRSSAIGPARAGDVGGHLVHHVPGGRVQLGVAVHVEAVLLGGAG